MANEFELNAITRETTGKAAARRSRRIDDIIPAVIYGGDSKNENINISHNSVLKAIRNEAFFSHILTVNVNGKKEKVVIKDMQRHPFKNKVLHMDFLRVKANEAITMHVPLHFEGEENAPGVKDGGAVSHLMTDVEIKCLPKDLPEFITVDVSKVELDGSIHLSQLKVAKELEIVQLSHDEDPAVISIHKVKEVIIEEEAPEAEEVADETDEAPAEEGSETEATE